jgi:hypothetical protein
MSEGKTFIAPVDLSEFTPTVENPIPEEILNQWREQGCAVISNFLPTDLINRAQKEIVDLVNKTPENVSDDFGGFSFPFSPEEKALNEIILHPLILSLARIALKSEVLLTQGEAWLKKSTPLRPLGNQDQRMHMDYPNHYLTHPSSFNDPEVMAMILYFDESTVCGAETAVVPREGDNDPLYEMPYTKMPVTGKHPWINDRTTTENYFKEHNPSIYEFRQKLYAKEKYVKYSKGTILLYRLDVYHRGTPIKENATRIVMNLGYKKADCPWITSWQRGWSSNLYDNLWGVIPTFNEDQKAALGIPRENNSYWEQGKNRENCEARFKDQVPVVLNSKQV